MGGSITIESAYAQRALGAASVYAVRELLGIPAPKATAVPWSKPARDLAPISAQFGTDRYHPPPV